jgi:SAM-dependent methyltransferase
VRIADLGAGAGKFVPPRRQRRAEIWGVDSDPRVKNNLNVDVAQVGKIEDMTFADDFFDVICSRFVFEHLSDPVEALNRIYPWLKPGGKVLILTVNNWHYYSYLGRWFPQRLASRLAGRSQIDTFPTYYAFNNPWRIPHQVARSRFGPEAKVRIILCEKFLYSSLAILRLLSRIYSLMVNACDDLRWLRAGLIVEITKK